MIGEKARKSSDKNIYDITYIYYIQLCMGCRTYVQKKGRKVEKSTAFSNVKFEDLIGRMCMMRILNQTSPKGRSRLSHNFWIYEGGSRFMGMIKKSNYKTSEQIFN